MKVRKKKKKLCILVLAAGLGKRMKSSIPKILHPIGGKPMLLHVLDAAKKLRPVRMVIVIGNQAEAVEAIIAGEMIRTVVQKKRLGTAHAVLQAERQFRGFYGTLLILNGDLPLITSETLQSILSKHIESESALTLFTTFLDDPKGYGRVMRDSYGSVTEIVEERDASEIQQEVKEINCGIYCAEMKPFLSALKKVKPNNVQREYYLPDAVKIMLAEGKKVSAFPSPCSEEVLGVNTRLELSQAAKIMNRRVLDKLMESGVTINDPDTTFIDGSVRIGKDTILYPNVHIEGNSTIGTDCQIFPGCRITDSEIGKGSKILDHSVIMKSKVGKDVQIGPFAHLRPESSIGDSARIGNFVEVKKSKVGKGTKASHLTYLGDSVIGNNANIGAGTITCNYDGAKKYQTKLGNGVFVGSDVQFIAPVKVGQGAYIGAGSTITDDVPPKALAISRARQTIIKGWASKKKRKKK